MLIITALILLLNKVSPSQGCLSEMITTIKVTLKITQYSNVCFLKDISQMYNTNQITIVIWSNACLWKQAFVTSMGKTVPQIYQPGMIHFIDPFINIALSA